MKQKTSVVAKEACHKSKKENCFSLYQEQSKRIKRFVILIVCCLNLAYGLKAQIPTFWGLNGWMPDAVGVSTPSISPGNTIVAYSQGTVNYYYNYNCSGALYSLTAAPPALGIKTLRYGGLLHDINLPTVAQYSAFVPMCNANAITPIIEIPWMHHFWFNYCTGTANITTTASASTYTNNIVAIMNTLTPMGVKYYSIGNEPDLYHLNGFSVTVTQSLSAAEIATYFKIASKVIKTQNSNAVVIGPDLASAHTATNDLMYDFIGGSGDITGTIPGISPTRYYCDIYAYHTYPYSGGQSSVNVISQPSSTLTSGFAGQLNAIRNRISSNSNNPNLKIAITELSINYANPTPSTSNTYSNFGANGYLAGQWLAEMYATALKTSTGAPVAFMMPWSLHESSGNREVGDLGLIDGTNYGSPAYRSTAMHTQMMTQGFTGGTVYMGTTTHTNVKAFSSKDCYRVVTMFMNQDLSSKTLAISQTSTTPVAAADVSITLNMPSSWSNKTISIGAQETQMIVHDACGNVIKQYTYSIAHSSAYVTPNCGRGFSNSILPVFEACICILSSTYAPLRCSYRNRINSL
jgi:hypothetical protein